MKLKKYFSILHISYRSYTVFFYDILGKNIIYILRVLIILTLYKAIYKMWWSQHTGYTLEQVGWWLIFVQSLVTSKTDISWEITQEVKSGNIVSYLLNPISYVWYKFVSNITQFSYNLSINLAIGFILGYFYLSWIPFSLPWALWWFILLVGSMLMQFLAFMIIWLFAFHIEDTNWLKMIYGFLDRLFWWNILPIPFFPLSVQQIIYLSPFAYTWYTAWLIFAKFEMSTFIYYISVQSIWILFYIAVINVMYNRSRKRLEINWW
ncbi:MAG: protein of unknown function DUF990 [uncultured bacterium (gcode 4)]|uniref:Uncharacterized protein n=1 Tax=uncultured bacterium (gcode 4) TaxID=1234023 RepID=K2FF53_9BACT|nr:MAG: protein of unknown function DUF990 [uncultured bacterium (gcode 4)]